MKFRRHQEAAQQSTTQLLVLFVLVLIGLVLAVNLVLAAIYWLTVPFARGLPNYFIETNTGLVLLFVLGGCYVESMRLHKGGPHVAELAGARPVHTSGHDEAARRERRFANVVQEMALASGQRPPPQAWVLPRDDAINAFAAGWTADDAVVAVTRGALERLTRAELQGVVAHEFSHLVHGDTRLNMRLVGLVWGLQMIWGLGVSLWSADEHGRRNAGALFGLGLMAVGSLGWLAGRLLQAAVSRQREFLADASAVKYSRQVDGLGGALRKIGDQQARRIKGLASAHAASLAHLLLSGDAQPARSWRHWLATHPTLSERLTRLYGRPLPEDELLLTADAVPLDAAEPDGVPALPILRMAASAAEGGGSGGGSGGIESEHRAAPLDGPPEAHRHDAMQVPAFHDDGAREREALDRIARWHGPGEWQAAMLALCIAGDTSPGVAGRWRAWEAATADLSVVAAVKTEIDALGPRQRRRVFDQLLERGAAAPPATRRRLWRAWSARWREMAGPSRHAPPLAWRALVMRHGLGAPQAGPARGSLASQAGAVHAATRQVVRCFGLAAEEERAWLARALAALQALDLPPPRGPAAGLAPTVAERTVLRALRVRRLSPMQRPLLLRAWVEAAQATGILERGHTADALHLVCTALKLPLPEALQR
jgi:Zn-dependent protease with chaperone function